MQKQVILVNGYTQQEREDSIIKFCLSDDLKEKIDAFDIAFKVVYGFQFSDNSTKQHKKIIRPTKFVLIYYKYL